MLIDSTLREGAQAFGIYLCGGAKRRMAELLAAAGVDELECGWIGQESLPEFLAWARQALPRPGESGGPALSVWCPCREADVRAAAKLFDAGLLDRLSLGAPSSAAHREKRLGLSLTEMITRVRAVVSAARAAGVGYVSVGLEDASRADIEEALELARAAQDAGAARVRLADTVGVLAPQATAVLVRRFVSELTAAVAFHGHNDLGMATANAVTALLSGAAFVDVSALGLGERAGIARMEEVAAWLALRSGRDDAARYDLSKLRAVSILAAQAARTHIDRTRPVVGGDVFATESGLHVHGMLRDPSLFEPFAPELVGARRHMAVGAKSGAAAVSAAVDAALKKAGREADATTGADPEVVARVRSLSARLGRPLTEEELAGVI